MSLAFRDGRPIGGAGVTRQKAVVEKYTEGDAFAAEAGEPAGYLPQIWLGEVAG
jgi:hypothetical protein